MDEDDLVSVDIVEYIDPHRKLNPDPGSSDWGDAGCDYHGQLQALLSGKVDAIFGKGSEAALLEREARGEIRLLYDISDSPDMDDRVNNSTPRLITTSKQLVKDHPEVVIRYLQGLLRAAKWAPLNAEETRDIVAFECGIGERAVEHYFKSDYPQKFLPGITSQLLGSVEVMKSFLYERGYIDSDFSLVDWVNPEPLKEAQKREASEGD
ncbi:MAG: ABC transporter substrate-binding protein [Gammaproteobacteria bacterium]|nr:ABC transporter substrate-binding protein [Gammaproteobacteria bacterium]